MDRKIGEGMTNPVWERIEVLRDEVRSLVTSRQAQQRTLDDVMKEALEVLGPALADELEAFTWDDGQEHHLDEADEIERLQKRLEKNLRRRKARRMADGQRV